jgi:hypothetical protein
MDKLFHEVLAEEKFGGICGGYGVEADEMTKTAIIAGIKYLEEHPDVHPVCIVDKNSVSFPPQTKENKDMKFLRSVVSPLMYGGSGAMYEHALSMVMYWVKHGSEDFLEQLRTHCN